MIGHKQATDHYTRQILGGCGALVKRHEAKGYHNRRGCGIAFTQV